ncbi:MAG: nucleotidyltransferase substrate binding protein [Parcubacteria group bacterium]|nr:nucleotidyltransferase substrate binding protein [Parcubacteria group bacterium]
MQEIFNSFKKSLQRLKEILNKDQTVENRDSAIQRFEFTIELAWKCAQKFLRNQEIICRSPKECLKEAFKFGLINDDPRWLKALADRNLTTHTYDEENAEDVYTRLPDYLEIFAELKDGLEKAIKNKIENN